MIDQLKSKELIIKNDNTSTDNNGDAYYYKCPNNERNPQVIATNVEIAERENGRFEPNIYSFFVCSIRLITDN